MIRHQCRIPSLTTFGCLRVAKGTSTRIVAAVCLVLSAGFVSIACCGCGGCRDGERHAPDRLLEELGPDVERSFPCRVSCMGLGSVLLRAGESDDACALLRHILTVGRSEVDEFPGKYEIAPPVRLWYYPNGNVEDLGYRSIVVCLFDRPMMVQVMPGDFYAAPSFTFAPGDQLKEATENLLKAVYAEDYDPYALDWTSAQRE